MVAADYALLIPLLPILFFPIILFLGQLFNGNETWKNQWKEGGTIATVILGISLLLSIWLIFGSLGAIDNNEVKSIGDWISFSIHGDGGLESSSFGFDIYVDHVTVLLLFVASFLCFLISVFSLV